MPTYGCLVQMTVHYASASNGAVSDGAAGTDAAGNGAACGVGYSGWTLSVSAWCVVQIGKRK